MFCSFILFIVFSYGLRLGFILESRITGSVYYLSLSMVSIGLMEARFVVVLGVCIRFKLSSTRG